MENIGNEKGREKESGRGNNGRVKTGSRKSVKSSSRNAMKTRSD